MILYVNTGVRVGFESMEVSLQEGNTTGLRVRVIGERVREFNLNLLQGLCRQVDIQYVAGECMNIVALPNIRIEYCIHTEHIISLITKR